ncbi:DUF5799 family protein [Halocatena pleomorpha]|uniref:Uncharacterized protein n=1 Tax=Halocatena pleomorpha TaxID=1785090 RepID=A0A3P3R6D7_9EURY|nr:DUF5799 family protein [Halocatena pleomorpha]RRJ28200.1 hypothetical protein EIK79_16555 [Halocatena pleomorpha]
MTERWTDRIVGARMAVDDEFEDRIQNSEFSRQQWGLVMTAVEFEIEHPGDPDRARIVANTDDLSAIMPELETVENISTMGSPARDQSGGILAAVKEMLGFDSSAVDDQKRETAEQLADEYARQLQQHLEQRGSWTEIRSLATDS